MSNVTNENNLTPKSPQTNENLSRKRKFNFENSETETSRKTKLGRKKNSDEATSSTKDTLPADNSSESKEVELSRKAKLKKYCDDETSYTQNNLPTDESSESKECVERKKKIKKMKQNKLHLRQLKSCLKGGAEYNLEKSRNVSFNEQVSYKILDTSLELCEDINDFTSDDPTMEETTSSGESVEEAGDEEPPTIIDSNEKSENNITIENNPENTKNEDADSNEEEDTYTNEDECISNEPSPQCLDLPKSSGSKFNFWLENQRQASKMKLYKEMMKKIKKNKILCSTNLLDIKGYGNWGL